MKAIPKINIPRTIRTVRKHATVNNGVLLVALFIAGSWAWGSVSVMQRNYDLQREVAYKERELTLIQLDTARLGYENSYYKTREYQELALRRTLGLALPGEKVLILSPNTDKAKKIDAKVSEAIIPTTDQRSNWEQWMNFFAP